MIGLHVRALRAGLTRSQASVFGLGEIVNARDRLPAFIFLQKSQPLRADKTLRARAKLLAFFKLLSSDIVSSRTN